MKFLTLLLSIYFFGINLYPCSDGLQNNNGIEQQEISSDHDEHEHDECPDLCAPFCYCHCCQASTISIFFNPYILPETKIYNKSIFGFFEDVSEKAAHPLLRPPRWIG